MYFDDVHVGQEIPTIIRGPLSPAHLMRWSAAIENWHRIHYDWKFATEHDGLPALPVNGSFKQHILVQLVSQFLGTEGWLLKLGYRFEKPDYAWDTVTGSGVVTAARRSGDFGVVECDLALTNQRGEVSTRGTCAVALPLRGMLSVPYPISPSIADSLSSDS